MDAETDLDPAEQRKRRAAERLVAVREEFAALMTRELEELRDVGLWDGSLADANELGARMGNAAMRVWLPLANVPLYTVPHYFDLPKEDAT